MPSDLLTATMAYSALYLGYLVTPALPIVSSILLIFRLIFRWIFRRKSCRRSAHESRPLHKKDTGYVIIMLACICSLVWLGNIIWAGFEVTQVFFGPSKSAYEAVAFIWYQLLSVAITCIFSWWWFRLKEENVENAFVFAMGGWLAARSILSLYLSWVSAGFNIALIEAKFQSIIELVVAFAVLLVLVLEVKRIKIPSNILIFILALIVVILQVSKTLFLDAMYIMIIPSIAIANWLVTSEPTMIMVSNKDKFVATLGFASSVVFAMLVSGVVPYLIVLIVAPNWLTDVEVEIIVILHFATWTAPFIGSTVSYFFMKRMSLSLISRE